MCVGRKRRARATHTAGPPRASGPSGTGLTWTRRALWLERRKLQARVRNGSSSVPLAASDDRDVFSSGKTDPAVSWFEIHLFVVYKQGFEQWGRWSMVSVLFSGKLCKNEMNLSVEVLVIIKDFCILQLRNLTGWKAFFKLNFGK